MAHYRARKDFETQDQRGNPVQVKKGELVDVLTRSEVNKLLREGKIIPKAHGSNSGFQMHPPAEMRERTLRVGFWIRTSSNYSGGRLHMYQYALAIAQNGGEAWIVTDNKPRWKHDYEDNEQLHVAIEGEDAIPQDFDLVVTDSKGKFGYRALEWCQEKPAKLVCFNFETPNWVEKYCPEYAERLHAEQWRDVSQAADLQLANSEPSLKHCLDWLGQPNKESAVLPPALNTRGLWLAETDQVTADLPRQPYAVWSARSADYKGSKVALRAAHENDLLLAALGSPTVEVDQSYQNAPDATKYLLMMNADVVLAPSLFEGFGMVPMEAMACRTPVVAYDLPVLRWAYGDRVHYAEWDNEDDFCRMVGEAKDDGCDKSTQVWVRETYGHNAMRERVETLPYHAVQRTSVSVEMLAWATCGLAPYAIDSVYDQVDQIVVAYGPVQSAKGKWDEDDTLELIQNHPDPDGKIEIEARESWEHKRQMRNFCADRAKGNYLLMLDADEIWVGLEELLNSEVNFGSPRWVNLWHGGEHWIHDGTRNAGQRWGYPVGDYGSVCPHWRFSWWRQSYRFDTHPVPTDFNGAALTDLQQNTEVAEQVPGCAIYHLGHAMPRSFMEQKHAFYEGRDGAPRRRREAWHDWQGETGQMADGVVAGIDWELPNLVKEALKCVKARSS